VVDVSVPAVHRASLVLSALAACSEPVTFGQLAAMVPLPRSSLHDVCTALVEEGFVDRSSDGQFQVGFRIVELARIRLARTNLVSSFLDVCHGASALRETTVLSVLRGPDVVYVAFVNADHPLAVTYQIGMRLPAHLTASGKAILATLPAERVREVTGGVLAAGAEPEAGPGRDRLAGLLAELEVTRARGFSVDDEGTARGMVCIGAPIFAGNDRHACAAIGISMVKATARPFETEMTDELSCLAKRVSTALGSSRSY
jgi:DNA-binding IclR family transcriptional regulator